jgi:hypothetical protein
MRVRRDVGKHRRAVSRGRRAWAATAVLAVAAGYAVAGPIGNAGAAQATGDDAVAWNNGWSWTYATVFHYVDSSQGTDVTINENVTYTNAGPTTFNGQSAYQVNLSGTITGGNGTANIPGTGTVTLKSFSGSVTGTEYLRRSDLALLQENQHQIAHATATYSIFSVGVDATIDMTLTPNPGWKALAFPLNPGDHWQENTNVDYSGGFSYTSSLASGSSPFNGTFPFVAPASNQAQTISVPLNGAVPTDAVAAQTSDGSTVDNQWWAPGYRNLAKEHLQVPLDTATLTIDRSLSGVSTPAPGTALTETITPSLTCAGSDVTVSGRLSSGASGVGLTATLDESADAIGKKLTASTTTGAGGNYSLTLHSPGGSDGLNKAGARAGWGVIVEGGGASTVATLVVNNQDCTSLTYTGDAVGPVGANATARATLLDLSTGSGIGGQTVTFALSGGGTVSATTNSSGVATAGLPLNGPVRDATVTATYAGTSAYTAASDSHALAITKDPTTTSVVASEPSATIGDSITFTAAVVPGIGSGPTGGVQFAIDGNNFGAPVSLSGGHATSAAISTLGLGNHSVTATYLGDGTFAGSTSPAITVRVHNPLIPTTTTLDVDSATSVYGQPVTLTATVAPRSGGGIPTGDVTFSDGGQTVGTAAVDAAGQASFAVATLDVGAHSIVATYSGDDTFDSSASAPADHTVTAAATATTVLASDSSTVSGQPVTFSASVATVAPGDGQPSGTVQLRVDGVATGDPVVLSGGSAIFPAVSTLGAGAHTIAVDYSGSPNFAASTGTRSQPVAPAQTATSLLVTPSPSNEDQQVTLTAAVSAVAPGSGNPSGTVIFSADGSDIGAAPLHANAGTMQASISLATLAPGDHTITARYVGDADYLSSNSDQVTHTVLSGASIQATTTTVESSTDPSTFGLPITFTASVANSTAGGDVPTGSVQFSVDGVNIGDPVPLDGNGVAVSPTLASPDPGDHLVIASYLPTPLFASSGAMMTQTVSGAGVDVALSSTNGSSDYGQGVRFHATVTSQQVGTGRPTGVVQFRVDGDPLGGAVALTNGAADSPAIATLTPGTHVVTVLYGGSVDFLPGASTLTQTVARIATATALASSLNPSTYGQGVTFTVTVTPDSAALGAPAGVITFSDGGATLATVSVAASGNLGTATFTTAALDAGAHDITATYGGSSAFAPSTSAPVSQHVQKAPTSLHAEAALVKLSPLGLPLGQLKATLTSPNGPLAGRTVVFKIGALTACVSTTNVDGTATCNALRYVVQLTLNLGYSATFAGDANYLPSSATAGIIK